MLAILAVEVEGRKIHRNRDSVEEILEPRVGAPDRGEKLRVGARRRESEMVAEKINVDECISTVEGYVAL